MQKRIAYLFLLFIYMLPLQAASPFDQIINNPAVLAPEQAFVLSVLGVDDKEISIGVEIAPGYYLYRDQFDVYAWRGINPW